eukprot:jgi/Picsp_1/634/NSC_00630-R1_pre-mrna cleavage complex ii protein family
MAQVPVKKRRVQEEEAYNKEVERNDDDNMLHISHGESVVLVGHGNLVVLRGTIDLHGYLISGSEDGSRSLPIASDSTFPVLLQATRLSEAQVPYAAPDHVIVRLDGYAGDSDNGDLLPPLQAFKQEASGKEVASKGTPECVPSIWKESVDHVIDTIRESRSAGADVCPPVICMCGPKNTGKSMLGRFVVNSLLGREVCDVVDYLDIDCGQSEFTPPGLVSHYSVSSPLLGPPYFVRQGARLERSHFIGDTSPASDPQRFIHCVLDLFSHANKAREKQGKARSKKEKTLVRPIVINSYGWVQGVGLDVLASLLREMPVTHFIRLESDKSRYNLPEGFFWMMDDDQGQRFEPLHYVLPAVSSPLPSLPQQALFERKNAQAPTPVERRLLQWNSFAMQCCRLSSIRDQNSWILKTSKPVGDYLAAEPPYMVSASDIKVESVFGCMPYSQTLRVLNASVVGLCYSENSTPDAAGNCFPCLGLGIVRSIDASSNIVCILTPLGTTTVQRVTHLLVGKLELPSSLLQTETLKSPYLALHAMASEGTGAGAGKSRNNLLRLSQLSGL